MSRRLSDTLHIPRLDFERRLEPSGDVVLHGAGQSPEAFKEYFEALGDHKPLLYMSYVTLKDEMPVYFQWLKEQLDEYLPYELIPQIGLHLAGDALDEQAAPHYEQEVADGQLDEQIQAFCEGLRLLQRPAYVRIGFEFNGPWNGYEPEAYKAAWRRIVSTFRTAGLVAELLQQYVDATAALRSALQTKRVFLNGNTQGLWEPMRPAAFEKRLDEFTSRHQIVHNGMPLHLGSTLFRRTFTTRALYEGRSLEALRSQLGHTTIMSTLLYSKLDLFEHPSEVRAPLDVYGRQVLSLWQAPQLLSELESAERAKLLKNSEARHQEVGLCRHDHCVYLAQGSPPPCSLCEHLVTGRTFLPAWYEEQTKREQVLKQLAEQPGTEVVYAQMKGQFDHFKRNLAVVEAEQKE